MNVPQLNLLAIAIVELKYIDDLLMETDRANEIKDESFVLLIALVEIKGLKFDCSTLDFNLLFHICDFFHFLCFLFSKLEVGVDTYYSQL